MLIQNHFFSKRLDSLVFSAIHAIRTRSNLACELDAPFPAWEKPWRPPQWSQPKSQGMQNAGPIPPGRETADAMLTNTISIAGSPERSAASDAATSGAARSRGSVTLPLLVRHGHRENQWIAKDFLAPAKALDSAWELVCIAIPRVFASF